MTGYQLRLDDTEEGREYKAFVDKFKPKKTTDDCYTPENIYQAVADWVTATYGAPQPFVRPFWPGGDYERAEYPAGCVVVDNPPFSMLARIMRHYVSRDVRFFLFAPTLTMMSGCAADVCYVPVGVQITYANGAKVNTSFVTNLDDAQLVTAPDLYQAVKAADDANLRAARKDMPKYDYPDHVLTAAAAYILSKYGQRLRIEKKDCRFIRGLDAQREKGKNIFGGALLLSKRAAAERAAAERAAAIRWALSERERAMVEALGDAAR